MSGLTYETSIASSAPATPAYAAETPNAKRLVQRRVHAGRDGCDLAVAQRAERAPGASAQQQPGDDDEDRRPSPRPRSRASAASRCPSRTASFGRCRLKPAAAAGHLVEPLRHDAAARPRRRTSRARARRRRGAARAARTRSRTRPRHEPRERDREDAAHPVAEREPARRRRAGSSSRPGAPSINERRGVRADADERAVTERDLAAVAGEDVQPEQRDEVDGDEA